MLGEEAGPVVAEGMDTLVAAQATASWVTCNGVGWLLQGVTTDSTALANTLLYVGIRRGSAEAAARRFGPAAAGITADSLDHLTAHGLSNAAVSLPLSSMGWALSATTGNTPARRILATPIHHTSPTTSSDTTHAPTPAPHASGEGTAEVEPDEVDAWILLGSPWLEGFVAVRGDLLAPSTAERPSTSPHDAPRTAGAPPPSAASPHAPAPSASSSAASTSAGTRTSPAPWRRVWCVLQDSAFAFFEHERAASDATSSPLAVVEWLDMRSLRLLASADSASSTPSATPSAAHAQTGGNGNGDSAARGASARDGHCFEVRLSDGRSLEMRADTTTQRALWVREVLRLASWRAVHALQIELAQEWHAVLTNAYATVDAPPPPLCSSPPRAAPPSAR